MMGHKKTNNFTNLLRTILFAWLALQPGAAVSQVISIQPGAQVDGCTDVDTLWIFADADILAVRAFDIKIDFESAYITASNVLDGSGLDMDDQLFFEIDNPNDSLVINIAILGSGDMFDGPDTVAGIVFTANNEIASTPVAFGRSVLRDTLNQDIAHSTVDATIEVDCTPAPVPVLVSPADGSFTNNVTPELIWLTSAGAVLYTLEYANNPAFAGATEVPDLSDTTYTMPSLTDGHWYWHVKSIDQVSNESDYSTAWLFTVDTNPPEVPTLALPTDGGLINDNTPELTWNVSSGAYTYTVEYADNAGFAGAVEVADLSDTTYTTPILSDGDWYWHVKAIDQATNESAYSTAWSFSLDTVAPGIPTLVSPADGALTNDNTVELIWNTSIDANTYTIEYADNAGFAGAVEVAGLTDTTYTTPALPDGDWYWHVKAVDQALNESAYSTARSFTVDTTAPLPPADLTASPAHNRISLAWTNPSGDFNHTVIMRSDWYAGGHDYPEYDNAEGAYPSDTVSFDLVYSGTGTSYEDVNDISNATRDIYHYVAFTVDNAANMSAPSTGSRATSYWLGDVAGRNGLNDYDGAVYFEDLLILSNCYWTSDGDPNYQRQFDIGPTDNGSSFGIPTTDNAINFEDLVIFAINFDEVTPFPRIVPIFENGEDAGPLGLSLSTQDEFHAGEEFAVQVRLNNNPGHVKAIHFAIPYDDSRLEFVDASPSDDIIDPAYPVFFDGRVINKSIRVSLVLLGGRSTIGGSGSIAMLTFKLLEMTDFALSFVTIDMRDAQNSTIPARGEGLQFSPAPELPTTFALDQNYPNPFNLRTRITYQTPEAGMVTIRIYNIRGQVIRTLVEEHLDAGYHYTVWDGRNDAGQEIASGVYPYRMVSKSYSAVRKMVLIK